MDEMKKQKFKKILLIAIPILIVIILIIFSIFSFNKRQEEMHVDTTYATQISRETIVELLDVFNTQNFYEVKEVYLPYQRLSEEAATPEEMVALKQKFIMDFSLQAPYVFEGVVNVKQTDSGTITGEALFKDNSQLVNYIEEYEAGWKNFGVQNLAEFEIVKQDGKMLINKFIVKETYTYRDAPEEFLDKLYSISPEGEYTFMTNN